PKDPSVAYLDADLLRLPLAQRRVRTGDRFHPFGMKGTKLLSDVMTDLKMPRFRKERQTVMTSAGDICWLTGIRPDERFRVTPATRRVMVLKVTKTDAKQTD
ncbi:MAG: tRNA lysidine(34) synthetase TilS, partial [Bacteroidaceae bacterium]|nr:tRNA lysidine(34) synthetase TilS [Bacteroidaceae bacterium]